MELIALKTPDDLAAARELIVHAAPSRTGRAHPGLPGGRRADRGRLHPAPGWTRAAQLAAGTALGSIRTNRDEHAIVSASYDGVLVEWLAHDADIVAAGEPLARLYPDPALDVPSTGTAGAR